MKRKPIVIIESPYAGNILVNILYAQYCIRDSILNFDEAPFASHMIYPGALSDEVPNQRQLGIETGFSFHPVAKIMAVYDDLGITSGMRRGMDNADRMGLRIELRKLSMRDLFLFERQAKTVNH